MIDTYGLTSTANPTYANLSVFDNGSQMATLPAYVTGNPETFSYDADGNLTADGRWNYTYDGENRLISMETNTGANNAGVPRQLVSFGYDYSNRRIWKKVQSGWNGSSYTSTDLWHRFVYQGNNLIAETDHNNGDVVLRNCFWGLDLSGSIQGAGGVGGLLMVQDGGGGAAYLPVYDAVGNVYGLLAASGGSLAATYEYDAFGRVLRESGPYATTNPLQFSTKYTDIETGLNDYGYSIG